ncbi:AraC family transcriptional regulator [Salsuginibacillus kocurii]|uniref:AraC family transcriptional regulator n=1 Tax=Salsuginibacillus kocurii TaxID=427078 RepID=UPI00037E260F|nr:AraC family transcriptional regulator [Salsuginibacillus kocurii]
MDVLKRMNEALRYIEEHITAEIDYKEAARQAYCSEYHFKRLFSLLAGIPLSEYVRRRRLTLAAFDLQEQNVRVIDVAMKYGYHSPDAFTRAFQNMHGVTPTEGRNEEGTLKAYPRLTFQLTIKGGTEMNYRIVQKEAFHVAGVKHQLKMINGELSPSYDEIVNAIADETYAEMEQLSSGEPAGIVHVTADYSEQKDGNATLEQYIGAVTTAQQAEGYSVLHVPAFTWAVFTVEGSWEVVESNWERIYSEWLPTATYELAEGPELLASVDNASEIWIPVVKK